MRSFLFVLCMVYAQNQWLQSWDIVKGKSEALSCNNYDTIHGYKYYTWSLWLILNFIQTEVSLSDSTLLHLLLTRLVRFPPPSLTHTDERLVVSCKTSFLILPFRQIILTNVHLFFMNLLTFFMSVNVCNTSWKALTVPFSTSYVHSVVVAVVGVIIAASALTTIIIAGSNMHAAGSWCVEVWYVGLWLGLYGSSLFCTRSWLLVCEKTAITKANKNKEAVRV